MKKCKKCLIEQDDSNFSKNKNNKDGLVNYCKKCEKIRTSNYRIKNREKINLKNISWIASILSVISVIFLYLAIKMIAKEKMVVSSTLCKF